MENITHLLEVIKSLSAQLFIFESNVGAIDLLKDIPSGISDLLSDPVLLFKLDNCFSALQDLNDYIKPLISKIRSFIKKKARDPMVPYADFLVDPAPKLVSREYDQLSFDDLIALNPVKPVKHRKNFSYEGCCPWCGADNRYLYLNNGRRQYACKVCKNTFSDKVTPRDFSGFYCPFCNRKLQPHHDRKGYIVYVCQSRACSYYKDKKAKQEAGEVLDLITSSKQFRYHYHYRQFKFNLQEIKELSAQLPSNTVDLSRIHRDQQTLGLILTYSINYGLSSRKVVNILRDIHGVKISHQTVFNYMNSVSALIKDMVDFYPYELSSTQSGDETYVHLNGRNHYVFFFSDPIKKFITSYSIFSTRDTKNAVSSIWNVLRKFTVLPDDLAFITDGNPIYNAAQLFFQMNGYKFDLHQVIGVKNNDDTSRLYRPFKQTEERLNRTFKENYYPMHGFGSLTEANSYMVLYTAFFNFLRRHSSLNHLPPVILECFDQHDLMPDKWLKLIQASAAYHSH